MTTLTTANRRLQRLRSVCGQYYAERIELGRYRLFDASGTLLGDSTFWINQGTKTRLAFDTGFGALTVRFSYPRYPRWFRRRWVLCFDMWVDELKTLVEGFGGTVLECFKPDMNCWSHVGFRATSEQLHKIDKELSRRGIEWNGPPQKPGQWDIKCPVVWESTS